MKIFPAIDIKDKKCVRLVKGDFDNKTEYEISPFEQAGKYKDHGFKNLHIVDLDGALTGETVNLDIIKDIVIKFDFKVEIGGGIRNFESIQKYTDIGVEKVILGSAAIKDKIFLKEACQKFPNRIALGLDAKDGYLSVSGWKESSNQTTLDYLKDVNDYGVSRLIYTDINRDGTKKSPNFEETQKVADNSNCSVVISGGVSSIDDIKKAKSLKNIENKSHMYFVHSYEFIPDDKNIISATTDYSSNVVCAVEKENIFGTQFHPEKSDKIGLKIIDNFINL